MRVQSPSVAGPLLFATCETGRLAGGHGTVRARSEALLFREGRRERLPRGGAPASGHYAAAGRALLPNAVARRRPTRTSATATKDFSGFAGASDCFATNRIVGLTTTRAIGMATKHSLVVAETIANKEPAEQSSPMPRFRATQERRRTCQDACRGIKAGGPVLRRRPQGGFAGGPRGLCEADDGPGRLDEREREFLGSIQIPPSP